MTREIRQRLEALSAELAQILYGLHRRLSHSAGEESCALNLAW